MSKLSVRLFLLGVVVTCLAASTYRKATIVSVHQAVRTDTSDMMRDGVLDTALVTTRSLVYIFEVRSGDDVYFGEYAYPGKPQDAPKQWNSQVEIRIQGNRMFIQDSSGNQLETRILRHTKS
jgi:extradiol dioxygenase family protein